LGYHECLAEIETVLTRRSPDVIHRAPGVLSIRLQSGEKADFADVREPRGQSVSYKYWGYQDGLHLLRLQFYEGRWFGVVDEGTGELTRIVRGGLPILSPAGRAAAAVATGIPRSPSIAIDMWSRVHGGLRHDQLLRLSTPAPGTATVIWRSEEQLDVLWTKSGLDESSEIGTIRKLDGEWELQTTGTTK